MKGHRWKGTWPWPIPKEEAEADYVEDCSCAFCRAVRELRARGEL